MSPSPPPPQVLHPSGLNWLLKCDMASSLLICRMLLPLVTIMILLSFFYEEVGILQLNPRRRESWMGREPHWIGWPVAGWSRGVARAEALVSLKTCTPPSTQSKTKWRNCGSEESGILGMSVTCLDLHRNKPGSWPAEAMLRPDQTKPLGHVTRIWRYM